MKYLILFIVLTINISFCTADIKTRVVSGIDYNKAINWNSGMELYLKGTTTLDDSIDLKWGFSEQYDGKRAAPFNFNHSGLRWDMGVLFHLSYDLKVGYIHSGRWNIEECNEESIFEKHSIDTFSIRKELIF